MQAQRISLGLLLALLLALTIGVGASAAATQIWIILQRPYVPPSVGETFTTDIKVSAWGGVVGALEVAVEYDPSTFRILGFDTPADSPFHGNCAIDAATFASGSTPIACFQVDLAESQVPVVIGTLSWQKLVAGGSTSDIALEPRLVVDAAWQPVEVQTGSLPKVAYSLGPGWNLTALAFGPDTDMLAQGLLNTFGSQSGTVSEVDRWYNGGWDAHISGLPFNDFPIKLGEGYFIKGRVGSCTELTGWAPWGGIGFILQPGWNLVGVPYPSSGYTAQALLSGMAGQGGACTEIDRWSGGGWDPHIKDLPFNDFAITPNEGYFVKCTQASGFIPSVLAAQASQGSWPAAAQPDRVPGSSAPEIGEVLVTNRRDVSLAVTWQTDEPSDGWVEYGVSGALDLKAYDDRGQTVAARTHQVTLGGLMPETSYYFRVHSGGNVADQDGAPFEATTRATGAPSTPLSAYGQVTLADGALAVGSLVIARLADGAGNQSEPLSALVDGWGWWVLSLPESDCDGRILVLDVIGPRGEGATLRQPACACQPAPALQLSGRAERRFFLPILITGTP